MNLYYRYLEGCRNFNELNDLPEKGWEWHHTLPQCLFGDQPIGLWLTKEQHAKASVLQSYAFGVCCVTGMMKKFLPAEWHEAFRFWRAKPMEKINKEKTFEERSEQGKRAILHPNLIASRLRENYSPERLQQRREWGRNSRTTEERKESGRVGGGKSKGKKWWAKGEEMTRAHLCPGEGWVLSKPPSFSVLNSPEAMEKKRKKLKGEGNGMFGKKHDEETLKLLSEQRRGLFHWVNSEGKTRRARECPGPEWQRGRKWRPQ